MAWSRMPSRIGAVTHGDSSGWMLASGKGRCACSAATCAAVKLETPTARVLPLFTMAASDSASAAGCVRMSGRCTCQRST